MLPCKQLINSTQIRQIASPFSPNPSSISLSDHPSNTDPSLQPQTLTFRHSSPFVSRSSITSTRHDNNSRWCSSCSTRLLRLRKVRLSSKRKWREDAIRIFLIASTVQWTTANDATPLRRHCNGMSRSSMARVGKYHLSSSVIYRQNRTSPRARARRRATVALKWKGEKPPIHENWPDSNINKPIIEAVYKYNSYLDPSMLLLGKWGLLRNGEVWILRDVWKDEKLDDSIIICLVPRWRIHWQRCRAAIASSLTARSLIYICSAFHINPLISILISNLSHHWHCQSLLFFASIHSYQHHFLPSIHSAFHSSIHLSFFLLKINCGTFL